MTNAPNDGGKPSSNRKILNYGGAAAGAVLGIVLSRVFGIAFWLPAILIGGAWLLLAKLKVASHLVPVLAIVIGHTLWIVSGALLLLAFGGPGAAVDALMTTVLELLVAGALVFWVLKKKDANSVLGLVALEVLGLVMLWVNAADMIAGVPLYLMMHAFLRLAGLAAAIWAIIVLKRQAGSAA